MPMSNDDAAEVFAELKRILQKHAKQLVVAKDTPTGYYLDTKATHPSNGRPICFGCAAIHKNYVSFYLIPVYGRPELLKGISPELKKRMQGKSCFNFKACDPALFKELAVLTKKGLDGFKKMGWA